MSRIQQDQFVDDDEEECCPLCVEEFDLSDRNFRPCPCGYQICQFCFNNIKTTMNGLCPACRRPYDESTIEFKNITPEEMAKHKQQIAQKAKKNAQIRQKEAQKAEADSLSRKHLAGLRVVQKNLVYVTGLTPTIREDRLLDTLRGADYFGQYGKIIKIVVSKARENAQHQQSVGVYVTFARKEDAAACIAAVDGSQNGERTLRAQYGTTKYCSAYLRGEQCNNRNCMFLHEPGEDNDSFTRQDLSMMNSIQTQQPAQSATSRSAPPAHHGPPVAAAATPMNRQDSNDASSPTDTPGLPATASWGSKAAQERRASRSTNASNPSPMTTNAVPAPQTAKPSKVEDSTLKKKGKEKEKEKSAQTSKSATPQPQSQPQSQPPAPIRPPKPRIPGLDNLLKTITDPSFKFVFSSATLSEDDFRAIMEFPQLLDPNGGAKRRAVREKEKELAAQREAEAQAASEQLPQAAPQQPPQQQTTAEGEDHETTAGGSLQLGGEPEEGQQTVTGHLNQHAIAPPGQPAFGGNLFGQNSTLAEDFGNLGLNNTRGLTQQQQQNLLLSNFKSGPQSAGLMSNFQNSQGQQPHAQTGNAPGHGRHASRFSFANDSSSASASVHPVANQKIMSQQSSMMPKNSNHFNQMSQHQPLSGQFYTSGVQGPPPGLKATGTPPVSGGGMFSQGHGFATGGLGYAANAAGRNNNDALYQDLLRGGRMDGGARVADAGKHDHILSPEEEASFNVDALVSDAVTEPQERSTPLGSQTMELPRRATPTVPPGFSAPVVPRTLKKEHPPHSISRNVSYAITPVVPVVLATPVRATTPTKSKRGKQVTETTDSSSVDATEPTIAPSNTPTTPAKSRKTSAKSQALTETPKKKSAEAPVAEQKESRQTVSSSPTKGTPKGKSGGRKGQNLAETPQKDAKDLTSTTAASSKRQHPGKLDIAAATKLPENEQSTLASSAKPDPQPKSVRAMSTTIAQSVPGSPAAISTGSPVKKAAGAKTLRVVATPKTETPPPLSAVSLTSLPQVPNVEKLRSRQASIASLNQPGTPVSELVSDTASITSTSFSRANSPPPVGGKVGTAPVRKKTKSQQKKDRQERARQAEEERAIAMEEQKSEPEVVQAPIVGRKKKAKKPAAVNPKPISGPTKSQPVSPKPVEIEEEEEPPEVKPAPPAISKKAQANKTSTPSPRVETADTFEHARDKREPTAQSVIADLQKTGELIASTLEFFKPLSSSLAHASRAAPTCGGPVAPPDLKIHFSEADLDALAKKKPVRLNGHEGKAGSRTLITPQGKFFWGLTQELEEKALELEKHIEELKGAARFHSRKQTLHQQHTVNMSSQAQSKDMLPALATALKEAGANLSKSAGQPIPKLDATSTLLRSTSLPLPPVQAPSDLSPPQQSQQQQTPADAGTYLNQFVLPKTDNPAPNTPRPEMAAVGGPPGAGTASVSVNVNKIAKAAKAVAEGGAVGTELEGMGVMAADLLGGVFVQGLEALVGAGLGFSSANQDLSLDSNGNLSVGGPGLDVQGLVSAFEAGGDFGGRNGRGRRGVLNIEEAEQAMLAARKDHEALEKKLVGLMKRNRKIVERPLND